MATCKKISPPLKTFDLPPEFEGLEGLLEADLKAMVGALTQRAHERLYLTRREYKQLQASIWDRVTAAVNESLKPLSAETR